MFPCIQLKFSVLDISISGSDLFFFNDYEHYNECIVEFALDAGRYLQGIFSHDCDLLLNKEYD